MEERNTGRDVRHMVADIVRTETGRFVMIRGSIALQIEG